MFFVGEVLGMIGVYVVMGWYGSGIVMVLIFGEKIVGLIIGVV